MRKQKTNKKTISIALSLKSYCSEIQHQFIPAGAIQQTILSWLWAFYLCGNKQTWYKLLHDIDTMAQYAF